MKKIMAVTYLLSVAFVFSGFNTQKEEIHSLTVEVANLRNSNGIVQFALYNKEGSIPDENYKKCYKKLTAKIVDGTSSVTFENIQEGKYAVNILHDEDKNGKIKKGLVLPKEGIGFSNYKSIGMFNKPRFSEASFDLKADKSIQVKIIYM